MVSAPDAVKLGMIDGLGTLDAVIGRLANGSRSAIGATMPTPAEIRAAENDPSVDPDENGNCPPDHEKGDDGRCHPMPMDKRAQAEAEGLRALLAARGA